MLKQAGKFWVRFVEEKTSIKVDQNGSLCHNSGLNIVTYLDGWNKFTKVFFGEHSSVFQVSLGEHPSYIIIILTFHDIIFRFNYPSRKNTKSRKQHPSFTPHPTKKNETLMLLPLPMVLHVPSSPPPLGILESAPGHRLPTLRPRVWDVLTLGP